MVSCRNYGYSAGSLLHSNESILSVISGDASEKATLWWSTFAVFIPIFLVDMAWRMRLIHGGADCKGLMWVAILVPSWSSIPVYYPGGMEDAVIAMPPAIALLVWGGLNFYITDHHDSKESKGRKYHSEIDMAC